MASWVLLPMRLFLGVTFIYAGIQKLTDPQYFNPSARGYIGKQIAAFAAGSPLHNFLLQVAVPHAPLFGALVAYGELAIGLGILCGLLFRPAAFFGMLINLIFFLSATWRVYPYFYGSDIVFIFCWITLLIAGPTRTGLPSLDAWLVQHVLSARQRLQFAPALSFFLGIEKPPELTPAQTQQQPGQGKQATAGKRPAQQSRYMQQQRAKESRRSFLWGALAGGIGVLGLVWLWDTLHIFPASTTSTTVGTASPSTGSTPSTNTSTATSTASSSGQGTVIAHVNAVQDNNSVSFTIPSNGDPGILVRLSNGQFVAYDAVCTHAGCPVSYDPSTQLLECPCHGAAFDPAKGAAVVQGPATIPLTNVPIQVNNSTGTITLSQ